MNNPTTLRYSRTMRISGTQYAAAIERTRRHDASGKIIVLVVMALLGIAWSLT